MSPIRPGHGNNPQARQINNPPCDACKSRNLECWRSSSSGGPMRRTVCEHCRSSKQGCSLMKRTAAERDSEDEKNGEVANTMPTKRTRRMAGSSRVAMNEASPPEPVSPPTPTTEKRPREKGGIVSTTLTPGPSILDSDVDDREKTPVPPTRQKSPLSAQDLPSARKQFFDTLSSLKAKLGKEIYRDLFSSAKMWEVQEALELDD